MIHGSTAAPGTFARNPRFPYYTSQIRNPVAPMSIRWQQLLQLPQQGRHLLLIGLMAGMLLGVQLLQASPLHQHAQHSVQCTLCHLQSGDAALLQHPLDLSLITPAGVTGSHAVAAPATAARLHYQSRAPPSYFL